MRKLKLDRLKKLINKPRKLNDRKRVKITIKENSNKPILSDHSKYFKSAYEKEKKLLSWK